MKLTYKDDQHAYWLDGIRCKGVTTIAKLPDDTYALEQWRKRMVAIGMALSPPLVERAAAHYSDRDQLNRIAEEAMAIAKANEAGDRGTAAHRITERIDLDEMVIDTALAQSIRAAWTAALDNAGLDIVSEYIERIVVFPDERICGRFDRYARRRSDGRLVVVDLKTGARAVEYPHAIACQMGMYANAPLMAGPLPPEGGITEQFMPLPDELDRETGVVIHVPAEGQPQVVDIDIASGWQTVRTISFPALEWRRRRDLAQIRIPSQIIPSTLSTSRASWVRARVERIIDLGGGETLAQIWSTRPDVPTFRSGGPRDNDDIDVIAGMCELVEMQHELPFGPSDPSTPPATTKKERATA